MGITVTAIDVSLGYHAVSVSTKFGDEREDVFIFAVDRHRMIAIQSILDCVREVYGGIDVAC